MSAAIGWINHLRNGYSAAPTLVHNMTTASVDAAYPLANVLTADPSRATRINYTNSSGGVRAIILRTAVSASNDKTFRLLAALDVRLPAGQWSSCYFGVFTADLLTGANYGTRVPADVVPIPGTVDRYNLYALTSADVTGRAVVEFVVTSATGTSGYVSVGHLWAGPALVFDAFDSGWKMGSIDPTRTKRGPSGTPAIGPRQPARNRLSIRRSLIDYLQAIGNSADPTGLTARRMIREAGSSAPVVAVMRDTNAHNLQTLSLYGLIQDPLPDLENAPGDYYGMGLTIDEWR